MTTTQKIMLSFLAAVAIGTILLSLPISRAGSEPLPFIDILFTATTSICVTGLVTVPTYAAWSPFGQAVILVLIQIGGLGVVTFLAMLAIGMNRRIGIRDRVLLQDAFNLNTMSGIVKFVRKVVLGTLIVEGVGSLLYMTVFVPRFGAKGIWMSVFNAISAFCNAGMDVISENSLCDFSDNATVLFATELMIILGGIGYVVWWDVLGFLKKHLLKRGHTGRRLTLHSKIALTSTVILLVLGAVLIFLFERNNPLTLKGRPLASQIGQSFFQSVTTRTAGFAAVPQENLSNASAVLCLFLMFIGGSPVGTAGGVKTVTMVVLLASAVSTIRNEEETVLMHRTINKQLIKKAASVVCISFMIMLVSTICLSAVTDTDAMAVLYETVSATATVGLSRGLTPTLNLAGKLIIIVTMYLGRIGPISLLIAFFARNEKKKRVKEPEEMINVG